MQKRRDGRDRSPMMITLGVGLCVVPFVFAMVAWWLGLRAGVGAALAAMVALAVVCWSLCASGLGPRSDTDDGG
jgi:Na+-driven multidrug efflux pump